MIVYLVHTEDRHFDPKAYPFSMKEAAIDNARRLAKSYCRHTDSYLETTYPENDESRWLLDITYSYEGDHVFVTWETLDGSVEESL